MERGSTIILLIRCYFYTVDWENLLLKYNIIIFINVIKVMTHKITMYWYHGTLQIVMRDKVFVT